MIPLFKVAMAPNVGQAVIDTLYCGTVTQGPKVNEFERALREYLGLKNIVTVNSATNALQLAVYLSDVRHGRNHKIISTPMTCAATSTAIKAMGGRIVWADIQPRTGNIDPLSVEKRLKEYPDVKAIMAVHWSGYPCDLEELRILAKQYNVKLIEDAAHAFGAVYDATLIGQISEFVCFSFQAIKHLTCVDGGALVCKSVADDSRAKLLRWFGINRDSQRTGDQRLEADLEEAGWKYHMNDLNATIGLQNLKSVSQILTAHRNNGIFYDINLQDIAGITLLERDSKRLSSYWIYTLLIKNRTKFIDVMTKAGIQVSQVHARNDTHTAFKDAFGQDDLVGLEEFANHQISIPCHWNISETDRDYIVNTIRKNAPYE